MNGQIDLRKGCELFEAAAHVSVGTAEMLNQRIASASSYAHALGVLMDCVLELMVVTGRSYLVLPRPAHRDMVSVRQAHMDAMVEALTAAFWDAAWAYTMEDLA